MTAMRFLPVLVLILAATTQVATADDKKSSTKSSTKAIEIQSYGFGVSNPTSTSASRSDPKKSGNGAPSLDRDLLKRLYSYMLKCRTVEERARTALNELRHS